MPANNDTQSKYNGTKGHNQAKKMCQRLYIMFTSIETRGHPHSFEPFYFLNYSLSVTVHELSRGERKGKRFW